MRFPNGTRLGAYDIDGLIGAGAMGEVYRATDSRLHRTVALKVLGERLVLDAAGSARFKREAQLLAALHHPNVASLYDLVEAEGTQALVLEYVEGETLAGRIARGALREDAAIAIAKQIAHALDAAHQRGIVHRDLKPSNVVVTADGTVKLLDFGIAKALAGDAADATGATMTAAFVRVGTPSYMSPEQARGEPVDRRSDIWAFGCVVFEMVTGQRAFAGDTASDAMAAVLTRAPDLNAVPPRLRPLVTRCLQPDPSRRLRDIGDATLWLDAAPEESYTVTASKQHPRLRWTLTAVGVLAVAAAGWVGVLRAPAPVSPPVQFEFSPPAGMTLDRGLNVSPDSRQLAFVAHTAESPAASLWIHSFDTGSTAPLRASGPVISPPVWSPDGRHIAIATGRVGVTRLEVVAIDGSTTQTLAESDRLMAPTDWSDGGVILYVDSSSIKRIAATGGTPALLTVLDETRHEMSYTPPRFLPDGRHFLYCRVAAADSDSGLYVGSIDAAPPQQDRRRLTTMRGMAVYVPSPDRAQTGYIVFNRGDTLFRQGFDAAHLELAGEPVRVAEHIAVVDGPGRGGVFNVSRGGVLTYRTAPPLFGAPFWFDRDGSTSLAVKGRFEDPRHVRMSPDGRRLLVVAARDAWLTDLTGTPPMKLTSSGSVDTPLWSPDGGRIVYETTAPFQLLSIAIEGGSPQTIKANGHYHPLGWSADGADLIAALNTYSSTGWDLVRIPVQKPDAQQPLLDSPANEGVAGAAMSADAHWLAYTSDTTGTTEIYVRPYQGPGAAVRVSPAGGTEPRWSKNGRELYYWETGSRLMAVAVDDTAGFTVKPPTLLLENRDHRLLGSSYDVGTEGRFIIVRLDDDVAPPAPITVVLHWASTLRR